MAHAVGDQDDFGRTVEGPRDLTDVVAIAILMASHTQDVPGLEAVLADLGAAQRLGLGGEKTLAVMTESAAEVTALTEALGD
jgi:methylmalonyl-CoA mutase cobalamin-binding subunit